jgi:catechol 2,3-dioxygenase-like lactoylglutathione lyase family enzyme
LPDLFAAIPTADFAVGRAWWERFFGREPDLLPNDHEAAWRVTTDGWIYVIGDPDRAGRALVTLLVDDLDAWISRLELDATQLEVMPGGIRTLYIEDPEGNTIQLGG